MAPNSRYQVSTSDHRLFYQTLRYSNGYVNVGLVYAILLLAAALDVLGWINIGQSYSGVFPLDREASEGGGDSSKRRRSALALMTAAVMGFLIALMVSNLRFNRQKQAYMSKMENVLQQVGH